MRQEDVNPIVVETKSRLLDFGPNGALSDIDGNMVIAGERAIPAPDTTARKEH